MIIAAIFVGIILLFFIFLTLYISSRKDGKFDEGVSLGVIIMTLLFLFLGILGDVTNNPYPTAMDVYQGKTTLEYKVVDDIKVDSVVIFKTMQQD